MAEFTVYPQYLRKLTLKSLHKMENMSKPLVEFTFSFSWWIIISNLMFDVLICINENVSLHKKYSRNKLCHCWKSPTCGFVQICNVQTNTYINFVIKQSNVTPSACGYLWPLKQVYSSFTQVKVYNKVVICTLWWSLALRWRVVMWCLITNSDLWLKLCFFFQYEEYHPKVCDPSFLPLDHIRAMILSGGRLE